MKRALSHIRRPKKATDLDRVTTVSGEIPKLTSLVYDAREHTLDLLEQESEAAGAKEAVEQAVKAYATAYAAANVDSNFRVAYGAGGTKWGRQPRRWLKRRSQRCAMRDAKVRTAQAALDGTSLPKNDPFWQLHWAPLGFNCHCRTYAVNARQVERLGRAIADGAPQASSAIDNG
jgi:hypothetical protein